MNQYQSNNVHTGQHLYLKLPDNKLFIPLFSGVLLRLFILLLAGTVQPIFDESAYINIAIVWNKTGAYTAVWPPGYAAVIAVLMKLSSHQWLYALKIFQILCSAIIGYGVIQMSHSIYGIRGAKISGYAWAFYLPLVFYTHRVWPETLFLALFVPSMCVLLSCINTDLAMPRQTHYLVVSGILFGLSLYVKESATYLFIPLSILLIWVQSGKRVQSLIYPVTIILILLPLTMYNYHKYERFTPAGVSLGLNILAGLNAEYINYDYNRDPDLIKRVHRNTDGTHDFAGRYFIDYGSGWTPSGAENIIDRTRADLRSAFRYALNHKKSFFRTRIKKLADFVTPLSFLVRDLSPEIYSGIIAGTPFRQILIVIAVVSVIILLIISWIQFVLLVNNKRVFVFFLVLFVYFGLTALLVSMSRFRIPLVPFLLVLMGGVSQKENDRISSGAQIVFICVGLCILVALWTLNMEEIIAVIAGSIR